jgi:hypothetical protein
MATCSTGFLPQISDSFAHTDAALRWRVDPLIRSRYIQLLSAGHLR